MFALLACIAVSRFPPAFHIGPLQVYWYGLVGCALVMLLATLVLSRDGLSRTMLSRTEAVELFSLCLLGFVIGARAWHLVSNDIAGLHQGGLSRSFFDVQSGGMSVHGGIASSFAIGALYCYARKRAVGPIVDTYALVAPALLACGRIGALLNASEPGRQTGTSFGIAVPGYYGCRYPWIELEIVMLALLQVGLWWFSTRKSLPGMVMAWFAVGYSLIRFSVEFFRESPMISSLTIPQWTSICVFLLAAVAIFTLRRRYFQHFAAAWPRAGSR